MIKLFGVTDKIFTSNGDKVITPIKAKVHKEDNGAYYLDLEASLSYVDDLTEGRIIVAPTPQGDQAFRVSNVTQTKHKVTTTCQHVFYDSKNLLIVDSYVVDKNCNAALDHLNSATEPQSPFTTLSDIGVVDSYRCVRKSLFEAIQVVIERWGGHLVRDNFEIQVRQQIGQDNGVTVRYGKNLKDITVEYNWDNVVTQLLPVGRDGMTLDDDLYVYAPISYAIPYTKTISFNQEIDEDEYKDSAGNINEQALHAALQEDLLAQAQDYINEHYVPKVNYTLKANLEKVTDVGDTVEVIDERLGVNILTNVIAYDYDCILGRYTQIEFGTFKNSLSNLVSNITSQTQTIVDENTANIQMSITNDLQKAQDEIWAALGDSYVVYEGDKILVVDNLPKESAQNVIMINNGGIAFSQTGVNGNFVTAWTIDGKFNAQAASVINFTADLIKGGVLKLGSNLNQNGQLEIYDEANNLICQMTKDGLKMYGLDGSYVMLNNQVGFAGYDRLGNKMFYAAQDGFHMKKSTIEEEITLCNKLRFIPITLTENGVTVNDGIGLVSVAGASITKVGGQ